MVLWVVQRQCRVGWAWSGLICKKRESQGDLPISCTTANWLEPRACQLHDALCLENLGLAHAWLYLLGWQAAPKLFVNIEVPDVHLHIPSSL